MKHSLYILMLLASISLYAQPNEPMLMLHADMHSATINSIATDAQGQFLLTCSDDKTARLWDASTGNRLRTFRPPVGYGNEGRLFACALSPDGNVAATGGQTGSSWNVGDSTRITVGTRTIYVRKQHYSVYIFETSTGNMLASIDGLEGEILDLKFTPDGKFLLVALGGTNGVSVIDVTTWKRVRELVGFGSSARSMAFSSSGELAVVSDDGYIRTYDNSLRIKKTQTLPSGKEPVSVDWSPDGKRVTIACADLTTVLVLDAETLKQTEMSIGVAKKVKQPFVTVAFAKDGSRIGAGNFKIGNEYGIRLWGGANMLDKTDFAVSQSNITKLIAMPDGSIVFCTSFPEIGRITTDGKSSLTQWVTGNTKQTYIRTADVTKYDSRHQKSFQVSDDGTVVGILSEGKNVLFFSLTDRELRTSPSSYPTFNAKSSRTKTRISSWENSPTPLLNNKVLNFLEKDELSRCVDLLPSGERMVFGADFNIYCLDKNGKIVWKRSTLDQCAAVKITGNSEMVVAAFNDGTVSWYSMEDGSKLLTLFAHSDRRRWVLWTDAGYYDCAMGAEDLIGWHLNQGKNRAANFYPISQFRGSFYRPDIINISLVGGEIQHHIVARTIKPVEFKPQETPIRILESLPPQVSIISPRPESTISAQTITIAYNVQLPDDGRLQSIRVLIDGRPALLLTAAHAGKNEVTVEVPSRDSEVSIIARNSFGSSVPASVRLKWRGAAEEETKPKLYILAVGVSQYDNKELRLQFAAKDAMDFVNTMKSQKGKLYSDVIVNLLTDKEANKDNILNGFDWLKNQTTSKDVAMLFIAGHGINDNTGSFFYLPVNADVDKIQTTCVHYVDIQKTVAAIPGKIIMFIDACHSGNVMSGGTVDLVGMVNELTDAENGAVVFTSSTGRQFSYEDPAWNNGAFTKALVEGIEGKADLFNTNSISFKTLDAYIAQKVKDLTKGRQSPTTIIPQSIPDFLLAML